MKKFSMERFTLKGFLTHLSIIFVCFLSLIPFLWLLSTAFKGRSENIFAYPPNFIPHDFTFSNFIEVMKLVPIAQYTINSLIVAIMAVVFNVLFASLAAYPLARMNFKGKKVVFFSILATIMVPFQTIMVPIYIITLKLNLVDTASTLAGLLGLVLPFGVSAFGIFLLRQAFLIVPKEIEESAVVDGCNSLQIFFRILLPMIKPQVALLAILTFISSWGDFLWPSIVLNNEKLYTLPVGINNMQSNFGADYRLVAAGSIVSIIPIVIFFLALQKYFISGGQDGAVKG